MTNARAVALGLTLLIAAGAGLAAPAGASTISGSLGGGKLPAKGKGVASVRAVSPKTGVIVADDRLGSKRFALKLPAGAYLLFAATSPFRGHAGVDRLASRLVKVRKGSKRRLSLSLRKLRRRARPAAGPHFVTVKYPAVWVQHFAVSGPPELSVLRKGLADMLITDLLPIKAACDGAIVEREHLADLLAEQNLPGVDPASRVPSGHLIGHNRTVTGKLTVLGTTATLTATVTNTKTGKRKTITRTGPIAGFFELEQEIVQPVIEAICGVDVTVDISAQLTHVRSGVYSAAATITARAVAEQVSVAGWTTPAGVPFSITKATITTLDPNCAVTFLRTAQPVVLGITVRRLPAGGYTVSVFPNIDIVYHDCSQAPFMTASMGQAWNRTADNLVTTSGPGAAGSRTLIYDDAGILHDVATVTATVTPEP